MNAREASNITFSSFECYIPLALGYLILDAARFVPEPIPGARGPLRDVNRMKLLVDHVHKTFGEHRVLDDISLRFEAVQTLALIGPSGGGKSTFLRILAGLEYPDDARSRVVIDDGTRRLPRNRTGEAPADHRHGVPGVQFVSAPDGAGERHAAARTGAWPPARRSPRNRHAGLEAFPARPACTQTARGVERRAAAARGHCEGQLPSSRDCCSSTNPPARSTRK